MHAFVYFGHSSRNPSYMKKDFLKTDTLIISEVPKFSDFWKLTVNSASGKTFVSVLVLVLATSK